MEKNIKDMFDGFLKYIGANKFELKGALIPEPKVLGTKRNLFLIGDAGCFTKFSLGGIIPAIMGAEAVSEIILNNSWRKYKALRRRLKIHQLATKILKKLDEKDFEELFEIMKSQKYREIIAKRDRFGRKEFLSLLSPKLAWFSFRKMLKR